jgi:RNA polymerase sigma-70 factor, ECF subfamily
VPLVIERSDADLMAAIAGGSRDAFRVLYDRHASMLLTRLHRRCGDPDVVDSALQDTFISTWRSASRYRASDGEVGAWLWSIAVRRLIDLLRKRPAPVPMATLPEPDPPPEPGTRAFALVHQLPPDLHSVVTAVYLDGLTTAETAVLLGLPQGTVKSRLSRARTLLREELR